MKNLREKIKEIIDFYSWKQTNIGDNENIITDKDMYEISTEIETLVKPLIEALEEISMMDVYRHLGEDRKPSPGPYAYIARVALNELEE